MIGSSLNKRIESLIKGSKLCRKFTDYLYLDEKKEEINIFMGIGFISGRDGLSEGLPIDILNMIIGADEVRSKLSPIKSKIHLLIADHMAYQNLENEDLLQAKNVAQLYHTHLLALLRSLDLQDKVVVHLSSHIIEDVRYQMILNDLRRQDVRNIFKGKDLAINILTCQNKYTASHLFYFLNQTALGKFFKEVYQCQIKIGWSKGSTHKAILHSEHYDEPHFDRFYRQVYNDGLSFIYVDSGHNLQNDASEVPYSAPSKGHQHRRLLFGQKNSDLTINPKLPLAKNISIYYAYLTGSNPIKECSLEEKLRVIQTLGTQRQTLTSLQGAFEKLQIDSNLSYRPILTPSYAVFRFNDALLNRETFYDARKKMKSGCVLL